MTATNHVLAGAIIVAFIDKPLVALPLAFLSHFVLDMIPHFGWKGLKNGNFLYVLATDVALATAVLISIFVLQLPNWQWLIAGGIIASSPDLIWLYYWVYELMGVKKPLDPFSHFAAKIQWSESTWGLMVEIPWFFASLALLFNLTV